MSGESGNKTLIYGAGSQGGGGGGSGGNAELDAALLRPPTDTLKTKALDTIPPHFLKPAGEASDEASGPNAVAPALQTAKQALDEPSTLTGEVPVVDANPAVAASVSPVVDPGMGGFRPRSLSIAGVFDDDPAGGSSFSPPPADAKAPASTFLPSTDDSVVWARKMNVQRPLHERVEDLGEIARGGFGFIHAVIDKTLLRKVAMKVLDAEVLKQDPDAAARFIEEAQVTGQLDHPNIVPVHEAGVDENGRNYFTMKMIKGQTLTSIFDDMRNQAITKGDVDKVLKILVKVCEALEFAHARGVIHRDIKPDNIMVGSHGQVYLMDWGICRIVPAGTAESQQVSLAQRAVTGGDEEGTIMGSPAYMAPEQARGFVGQTDAQSDVFCLGACLYQFLTSVPPYNEATAIDAVKKAQRGEFRAPDDYPHGSALPPELVRICKTMMAPDKSQRYPTVTHVRDDLERFLTGGWWFATKRFPRNVHVVKQGDEGKEAYIIVKGNCEVFRIENGRKVALQQLGPGDVFGEMALLTNQPRTASIRSITNVEVMIITKDDLDEQQTQDSWLASFVRSMADRFRDLDRRYHAAKRAPKDHAVINRILERMIFDGRATNDGKGRWLTYSKLMPALKAELGRTEDEIDAIIARNDRLEVDLSHDRIVLHPQAGGTAL